MYHFPIHKMNLDDKSIHELSHHYQARLREIPRWWNIITRGVNPFQVFIVIPQHYWYIEQDESTRFWVSMSRGER